MKIVLRPPDKTKKTDDVEIDINADELIESVRQRIQEKKGIECHKLIFKGATLRDDRTLRSYEIPEGAAIIVQSSPYSESYY
mmetsp:Transcript_12077/g.13576  ORF Transcript_12077/g.13576 Transcript_12077/m.13576 type:complete len:82 (+) Transcript_12077:104-349(+)